MVRFRESLDAEQPRVQELAHVTREKEVLSEPAERSERRPKVEYVSDERPASRHAEEVVMLESGKCATHHRVSKVMGAVVGCDAAGELLRNAEMACAPGHFVAQLEKAGALPADGLLTRARCRLNMRVDTPRQVEAAVYGC